MAAPPPPPPAAEKKDEGKGARKSAILTLDMVLGFGESQVAVQRAPTSGLVLQPYEPRRADMTVESFVPGIAFRTTDHVFAGVRVPFVYGSIRADESLARSTSAMGNVELRGDYKRPLDANMHFYAGLGVALPTGQGEELPAAADLTAMNPLYVDKVKYDRLALNRGAQSSRGFEDNALFAPHRLGITPVFGLKIASGQLHVEPWLRVTNLVRTSDVVANSYVGQVGIGTRVAYRVVPELDLGVRLWGNIGFSGETDKVFVAEPEVRGNFASIKPTLGVIVPVAGQALTDPRWTGVRLSAVVPFLPFLEQRQRRRRAADARCIARSARAFRPTLRAFV